MAPTGLAVMALALVGIVVLAYGRGRRSRPRSGRRCACPPGRARPAHGGARRGGPGDRRVPRGRLTLRRADGVEACGRTASWWSPRRSRGVAGSAGCRRTRRPAGSGKPRCDGERGPVAHQRRVDAPAAPLRPASNRPTGVANAVPVDVAHPAGDRRTSSPARADHDRRARPGRRPAPPPARRPGGSGPRPRPASPSPRSRSRSARAVTSRRRTPVGQRRGRVGQRRGQTDHHGLLLLRLEPGRDCSRSARSAGSSWPCSFHSTACPRAAK